MVGTAQFRGVVAGGPVVQRAIAADGAEWSVANGAQAEMVVNAHDPRLLYAIVPVYLGADGAVAV